MYWKFGIKNVGKLDKNKLAKWSINFTEFNEINLYCGNYKRTSLFLRNTPVILRGKGHNVCSFTLSSSEKNICFLFSIYLLGLREKEQMIKQMKDNVYNKWTGKGYTGVLYYCNFSAN